MNGRDGVCSPAMLCSSCAQNPLQRRIGRAPAQRPSNHEAIRASSEADARALVVCPDFMRPGNTWNSPHCELARWRAGSRICFYALHRKFVWRIEVK